MTKEEFIEGMGYNIPFSDLELRDPSKINPKEIASRISGITFEEFESEIEEAWKEIVGIREDKDFSKAPDSLEYILLVIRELYYLEDQIEDWIKERKSNPSQLLSDLRRASGGSVEFRDEICEWLGDKLFEGKWKVLRKYIPNGLLGILDEDLVPMIESWIWWEDSGYSMVME